MTQIRDALRLLNLHFGIEKSFAEWSYLHDQQRRMMVAILVAVSLLPLFFHNWLLPSPQASVVGILLFGSTLLGHLVARSHHKGGLSLALIGLAAGVWLIQLWWLGPGASALWLLPVMLATQLVGSWSGLLWSLMVLVVLIWAHLLQLSPAPVAERAAVGIVLLVFNAATWATQHHTSQLITALLAQYHRMLDELEAAREHRLAVKQVNQDLVDAYIQLRKLNEMLQASRLEAETARRTKEQFVANVSHELRTPLNMIIGLSEMILTSPDSYGTQLPLTLISDMGVIHRNSQHLSQLINDVLDLSQTEAGKLPLYRDWVNANHIVEEAMSVISPLFQARGLYLRKDAVSVLPRLYCDRVRVRQILLNLLSNAGRYTEQGGVVVSVRADDNALRFSVCDSGPGIDEADQARIFEPFQQAHRTPNQVSGGTGLGLSICRQFVELHGGKMWVESVLNQGSTFTFQLPLPAQALPISGAERWINAYTVHDPRHKYSTESLPTSRKRLVVLDPNQQLARRLQADWPEADVCVTTDLAMLKAEVARLQPDILLVNDVRMMQDRHFIRHALTLPDRLPILSCYIPGREEAWKHLNIVEYLTKPVMRTMLVQTAEKHAAEGATILIAEDDRDTARLTRRQLASAQRDYRILTVNTGEDVLAMLRSRPIDLVCLDMNLPDIDGYQILQEKNEDLQIRDIPVVVISARDPTGDPVVAGRLRVETAGGLSIRDLVHCTKAMEWAFSV